MIVVERVTDQSVQEGIARVDDYNPRISKPEADPEGVIYELCSKKDELALCGRLITQIEGSGLDFDTVLAIKRGGVFPGEVISEKLGIPTEYIWLRRYKDVNKGGEIEVLEEPDIDLSGKRVLIVDEINDQGKTLEYASELLEKQGVELSRTAVMHQKTENTNHPAYYVGEKTSSWVVYMQRETGEFIGDQFTKAWAESPVDSNLNTLLAIGFTKEEILTALQDPEAIAKALDYLGRNYTSEMLDEWRVIAEVMLAQEG